MTILVDIGSTVVKVVELDSDDRIANCQYYDRDYDTQIYTQVSALLGRYRSRDPDTRFRICSSANGGLRIGIVCLTERFSGNVAKRLALAAGGNVMFTESLDDAGESPPPRVDALVLVGGIDCPDVPDMASRLAGFDPTRYQFQTLLYAGNSFLADEFRRRWVDAIIVENPLGAGLDVSNDDLLRRVRNLYLDDLVDKEGVSRLQQYSEVPIAPTPSHVNVAYDSIGRNGSDLQFPSPCIVIDIGGATTDVHFGLEVMDVGGSERLDGYRPSNRHVFTELGVFASRSSAIERLSEHERLYDFLRAVYGPEASRAYSDFREGTLDEALLFDACFFLALDSMSRRDDGSSPTLNIGKVNSIVVTGGASKRVNPDVLSRISGLLLPDNCEAGIRVYLDANYELWVHGMRSLPRAEPPTRGR